MPSNRAVVAQKRSAPKASGVVKFSDKLTVSLNDITKMIQDHKEMIDAIQDISLELTSAIGTLHELTVKYAGKANQILDVLLPLIKNLPIIPKNITQLLVDLEKWTQKIIDNSQTTSKTIADVHSGLTTGDVNKLKGHTNDLKKVTQTLTSILPAR
jgi:methyl-accepting chemotaxis protein